MRTLVLAALLALPLAAQAQPAPPVMPTPPDPAMMQARQEAQAKVQAQQEQGFILTIADAFKREASLRAQVIQLQDALNLAQQQMAAQKTPEPKAP